MIQIRKANERGHFDHGWLNTYHSFSFADYYDPAFMGFRSLRVINEDRVQPAIGFPTHPHRDMEIISYVLEGGLAHKDSMGNGSTIRPGDVQRMSAGTGITHSEFNASKEDLVHFLQIWIVPEQRGLKPSYEQTAYSAEEKRGKLRLIASRDGRDGSVTVHQDMSLYASLLGTGQKLVYQSDPKRYSWLQVIGGAIKLNDQLLEAGDGAMVKAEETLAFEGAGKETEEAEILLFDLA